MAFDYKKEYKEFYMPPKKPTIVEVPKMNYIAVRGQGNPNEEEGMCVQCMHIGAYDEEPLTVEKMHAYMEEQGYELDFTEQRMHHEIYLSDPRRTAEEKLKTVVRHPVKQIQKP